MSLIVVLTVAARIWSQDLTVVVVDADASRTLRGVTVRCNDRGAITNRQGMAVFRGCTDTVVLTTTMLGYVPRIDTHVVRSSSDTLVLRMSPRSFTSSGVTVTASRTEQPRDESPLLVAVTDRDALRSVQALSLAEGLSFQPGLRIENNCQNCGFTQVRLNGLQGPYTQILIDSRPVFSSLAGVYGLEHIPSELIERIEVVRGAGSALYGSGAIAGTVNVISRDPTTTSVSVATTGAWMDARIPDAMTTARGTWASEDLRTGITVFGVARHRSAYDHNGDTYSEMSLLATTSGGLRAVHEFTPHDRLTIDGQWIREFRRGGNLFDRPPYQADIAEQLDHAIAGVSTTYEHAFDDDASRISMYASGRSTLRASYYGGTGGDSANIEEARRYFGTTDDAIGVAGLQATTKSWAAFDVPLLVTAGVELQRNILHDAMPGYERRIEQRTTNIGAYTQVQVAPASTLSVALGVRTDLLQIDGQYQFDMVSAESLNRTFLVVNPRISLIVRLNDEWQLRTSYATGFRGPQTFDEDLHISTLQGAARLIRLDPGLRPERSHSFTLSLDGTSSTLDDARGATIDVFATLLTAPFVTALTSDTLPGSNASVARKSNGDGAWVAGTNIELRYALTRRFELTTALTMQQARYITSQVVAEHASGRSVTTPEILRTPDLYASVITTWKPLDMLMVDVTCVATGPMWVVNERLVERVRTPWFFDMGLRGEVDIDIDDIELRIGLGAVNVFNAYQRDLEVGPSRDAGFIYGPMRPRTFTCTVGISWQ